MKNALISRTAAGVRERPAFSRGWRARPDVRSPSAVAARGRKRLTVSIPANSPVEPGGRSTGSRTCAFPRRRAFASGGVPADPECRTPSRHRHFLVVYACSGDGPPRLGDHRDEEDRQRGRANRSTGVQRHSGRGRHARARAPRPHAITRCWGWRCRQIECEPAGWRFDRKRGCHAPVARRELHQAMSGAPRRRCCSAPARYQRLLSPSVYPACRFA